MIDACILLAPRRKAPEGACRHIMATITIRGVSEDLVLRIKSDAQRNGRSMEQELRELLASRYRSRSDAVAELRARWERLPELHAEDVDRWVEKGRS